MRNYLEKEIAVTVKKTEINGRWNPLHSPCDTILFAKVGTNFADK
jgi:hypothetical protein